MHGGFFDGATASEDDYAAGELYSWIVDFRDCDGTMIVYTMYYRVSRSTSGLVLRHEISRLGRWGGVHPSRVG